MKRNHTIQQGSHGRFIGRGERRAEKGTEICFWEQEWQKRKRREVDKACLFKET